MLIYSYYLDCNSWEITQNTFWVTWKAYSFSTEKIQTTLFIELGGS